MRNEAIMKLDAKGGTGACRAGAWPSGCGSGPHDDATLDFAKRSHWARSGQLVILAQVLVRKGDVSGMPDGQTGREEGVLRNEANWSRRNLSLEISNLRGEGGRPSFRLYSAKRTHWEGGGHYTVLFPGTRRAQPVCVGDYRNRRTLPCHAPGKRFGGPHSEAGRNARRAHLGTAPRSRAGEDAGDTARGTRALRSAGLRPAVPQASSLARRGETGGSAGHGVTTSLTL